MTKKNPRIGKSQIAGGVKVQLPIDSPLIGVLKTDQYDVVNLYTNEVDKTYVATNPGDEDPDGPGTEDPGDGSTETDPTIFPNLEDITLIGANGTRYSSGQTITDPEIYHDSNNNRKFKVTFEVKNNSGEIVKGVVII